MQGAEQRGPVEYPTGIGTSDATSIHLLGHDLAGELMGKVGFGELALWLATQQQPTPQQVRVFEAVLVSLADHGFTPTAIAARLTLYSAPDALQGAIAEATARVRFGSWSTPADRGTSTCFMDSTAVPVMAPIPTKPADIQDTEGVLAKAPEAPPSQGPGTGGGRPAGAGRDRRTGPLRGPEGGRPTRSAPAHGARPGTDRE